MTLWTYLHRVDLLVTGKAPAARLSGELRQHEDRHGSNPKALALLRWRIAEEPDGQGAALRVLDHYAHLRGDDAS